MTRRAPMALAVICSTWLNDIAMDLPAVRLTLPMLESWAAGGRPVSREVIGFGLEWALPPADGV